MWQKLNLIFLTEKVKSLLRIKGSFGRNFFFKGSFFNLVVKDAQSEQQQSYETTLRAADVSFAK